MHHLWTMGVQAMESLQVRAGMVLRRHDKQNKVADLLIDHMNVACPMACF